MEDTSVSTSKTHGWLDHLAIGMASVCAIHCLLTPILVTVLPIIATSFVVHEDFHLWMLLLVLPTTSFAIFMGCRRHKDRWVATLSVIGLGILISAFVHERTHAAVQEEHTAHAIAHAAHCESCARDLAEEPIPMHAGAWFNTLGGLFLAGGHVRNFRLCRKNRCEHD